MDNTEYGALNGHTIGIVMKELIRRATVVIRSQRHAFEAQAKAGYSGDFDDVVTSADKAAQAVYLKSLRECFPEFGIIAEEEHLRVPCTHPTHDVYFTVDPLDGTKAFVRRQSHGVGTMLALVSGGEVIAAYVGDVNTQEVYGYRPGSDLVHRITEYEVSETLRVDTNRSLAEQYILLREHPNAHPEWLQTFFVPQNSERMWKGIEVTGGSIGVAMARLWKGEVGSVLLHASHQTPWDLAPVVGISQKLGFVFLRVFSDTHSVFRRRLVEVQPAIRTEPYELVEDTLVVHHAHLPLLFARMEG